MTAVAEISSADRAAVAAVPGRIVEAWARHDAEAFASVFTEDGSMILPGVLCQGRDEIRGFMADGFAGAYQGTRLTGAPVDIRVLGAGAVVMITQGGVLAPGEAELADGRTVRATWVVVKRDGDWRLAAYQNSPAAQPAPA